MSLKIAIVVHGRFYAFDLARELIRQGAEVSLLTNYPKRIAGRFGVPAERVRSCISHGVAARMVHRLGGQKLERMLEPAIHRWFSRWASRTLAGMDVDAVHAFSGVSEEILRGLPGPPPVRSLVRGSAHIRTQARLLAEEQQRCGCPLDQPSRWMIERESREYDLADIVIVLSSFAANSFLSEGFPREKLRVLLLGSQLDRFRPSEEIIERRCRRILAGEPLRVLTVGTFSFQKGVLDLTKVAEQLSGRFCFRFVGDCPSETSELRKQCRGRIDFVPRQPQFDLPRLYEEGDLFLFPTIQDGYPVVLAQASAGGLPILTTGNCSGPDLVCEGETGWVLPIRRPDAFVERLRWCDSHRAEVAEMVRRTFQDFQPRDWSQVAADLLQIYQDWFASTGKLPIHGERT